MDTTNAVTTTAAPSLDAVAHARAVRAGRLAIISNRVHELSLRVPIPAEPLDSPEGEFKRIDYTQLELNSLLKGMQAIRELYGTEFEALNIHQKQYAMIHAFVAAMKRLLPVRRQKSDTADEGSIPKLIRADCQKMFGTYEYRNSEKGRRSDAAPIVPEGGAAATPPPEEKKVIWTHQEEQNVLIHLAHLMHAQRMHVIPETSDRFTNVMFQDMIRDAQRNALPRHRRIDLSLARSALMDLNLMFRLSEILKYHKLPPLPAKGLEIDEIMAQKPAAPVVPKINGEHRENGSKAPLVVLGNVEVADRPRTEAKPTEKTLASMGDAEIFQLACSRFLANAGKVETMERTLADFDARLKEAQAKAGDAVGFADELVKENDTLRERMTKLERALFEMDARIKDMATKPENRLPRVAILGCRKDIFDEIVDRAKSAGINVDFRHIEQQHAKIYDVHADWAIMMPGLSHAQQDHVIQTVPRGQFIYMPQFSITGTIAQLRAWFQTDAMAATGT